MADIKLVFPELKGVERGAKLLAQDFKSKPIYYLAREAIQNSIDAWTDEAKKAKRPVKVVFRLHEVPTAKVLCRDEILDAFDRADIYWKSRQEMFAKIWETARSSLKSPMVRLLEVSDYNTCGLEGDDRTVGNRWHSLVKSEGVPNPNSGAGGSYGIGKMAPFACSDARTVLYATRTAVGHAFQGVCRLATFEKERVRRAPDGFIGLDNGPIAEPYVAVRKERDIPPLFLRSEVGTSVWCVGFIREKKWVKEVIAATLDSFWLAIHLGNLEVEVISESGEKVLINQKLLPSVIRDAGSDANLARNSLLAYETTNEAHKIVSTSAESFHATLGPVKLYLAFGSKDQCSNQCYQVRNNYMRIRSNKWRCPVDYTAVVVCDDQGGSTFLRSMEPPSHEDWVPALLGPSEQTRAGKVLNDLEAWLRKTINAVAASGSGDEIVEELTFDGENSEGSEGADLQVLSEPLDPFGSNTPVKVAKGGDSGFGGIAGRRPGRGGKPRPPVPRPDGTVDGNYFYARVIGASDLSARVSLVRLTAFEGKTPSAIAFTTVGSEGELELLHPDACKLPSGVDLEKERGSSSYFLVPQGCLESENVALELKLSHARDMRLGIRFKFKS
jgi:hypothetical protein